MSNKFLDNYKDMALNEQIHIECPFCSTDGKEKMYVLRTDEGIVYHCFRCGEKGGKKLGKPTLKQRYNKKIKLPKEVRLPDDFTLQLPPEGNVKMLQYGIDDKIRQIYNIGYSATFESLVYPLYHINGKLKGVQYRRLDNDPNYPKYITRGDKPVYFCHNADSNTLVLTEDILSAVKVSEYHNSLCLLGTKLSTEMLKFILTYQYEHVIIWLDNDKAGVTASKEIRKTLDMYSIPNRTIFSDRDPKDAMHREIKEKLYYE